MLYLSSIYSLTLFSAEDLCARASQVKASRTVCTVLYDVQCTFKSVSLTKILRSILAYPLFVISNFLACISFHLLLLKNYDYLLVLAIQCSVYILYLHSVHLRLWLIHMWHSEIVSIHYIRTGKISIQLLCCFLAMSNESFFRINKKAHGVPTLVCWLYWNCTGIFIINDNWVVPRLKGRQIYYLTTLLCELKTPMYAFLWFTLCE